MEETQNTEQKPNYIELEQDPTHVGNIFNELSGELGELDFGEKKVEQVVQKKNPLHIIYSLISGLFTITLIVTILLTFDVFARSSVDSSLFANLPICSYLSYGITDYDNVKCQTPLMILPEVNIEKKTLEDKIITNLVILVPKLMQSLDILNSPKIQFIQEHTGDSRVSISEIIAHFQEIKNRTNYQGNDIDCAGITADETGKFSTSCAVYGGALLAPAGQTTKTSREIALAFLGRLGDTKSGFQILSYPKSLDISEYSSTDGFKTVFSTKTSLDLKLQYLPANKM